MITSRPAEAIGMGGEIGSLAAGRRADLVIWSGDPLEGASAAEQVYIDGVRQPLATHETRLLERYRYLPRRDLPRLIGTSSSLRGAQRRGNPAGLLPPAHWPGSQ